MTYLNFILFYIGKFLQQGFDFSKYEPMHMCYFSLNTIDIIFPFFRDSNFKDVTNSANIEPGPASKFPDIGFLND